MITSGLIPKRDLRTPLNLRCIGYLPSLLFSNAEKKKLKKKHKLALLKAKHDCLALVVKAINVYSEGFYMFLEQKMRRLMPKIAFIVNDQAEAHELAGHYSVWNVQKSCHAL
jgi:hypothetical protein